MKYVEVILKTSRKTITFLIILFFCSYVAIAQAPSHIARFSPQIDDNINGFWEYLPRNYSTDTDTRYPLIIFLHGAGAQGSTPDMTTISKVLENGAPKLIANNQFPETFLVNGKTFRFIIISPQIKQGISGSTSTIQPSTLEALLQYALSTYRVDPGRIYVAGMSMGGGATWDFAGSSRSTAQRIAGIAIACGAGDLTSTEANNIAAANLPVLATHNYNDHIIEVSRTVNNIQLINNYTPAIRPTPKTVYWSTPGFNGDQHDVWTRMFEALQPGITDGGNLRDTLGVNAYEWLLQHTRTSEALPVVWKSFEASLNNRKVALTWKVTDQKNVRSYIVERSGNGTDWSALTTLEPKTSNKDVIEYTYTDNNPINGNNFYRIRQTDHNGAVAYSVSRKVAFELLATDQFRLFPNPFKSQITISVPAIDEKDVLVQLFDGSGKLIHSLSYPVAGNGSIVLNSLENLNRGAYHIHLKNRGGRILYQTTIVKN